MCPDHGKSSELTQGRQRRLRERHKTMKLMSKNNTSARRARAFCILVHFFAVLVLTTGSLSKDDATTIRPDNRELKRHITIGLISKNNSSARPARAFYILVHFFAVLVLTTGSLSKDDDDDSS